MLPRKPVCPTSTGPQSPRHRPAAKATTPHVPGQAGREGAKNRGELGGALLLYATNIAPKEHAHQNTGEGGEDRARTAPRITYTAELPSSPGENGHSTRAPQDGGGRAGAWRAEDQAPRDARLGPSPAHSPSGAVPLSQSQASTMRVKERCRHRAQSGARPACPPRTDTAHLPRPVQWSGLPSPGRPPSTPTPSPRLCRQPLAIS